MPPKRRRSAVIQERVLRPRRAHSQLLRNRTTGVAHRQMDVVEDGSDDDDSDLELNMAGALHDALTQGDRIGAAGNDDDDDDDDYYFDEGGNSRFAPHRDESNSESETETDEPDFAAGGGLTDTGATPTVGLASVDGLGAALIVQDGPFDRLDPQVDALEFEQDALFHSTDVDGFTAYWQKENCPLFPVRNEGCEGPVYVRKWSPCFLVLI